MLLDFCFPLHHVIEHVTSVSFEANALRNDAREIEVPCIATNEKELKALYSFG